MDYTEISNERQYTGCTCAQGIDWGCPLHGDPYPEECGCVLPEQTCPVCAPYKGDGLRHWSDDPKYWANDF